MKFFNICVGYSSFGATVVDVFSCFMFLFFNISIPPHFSTALLAFAIPQISIDFSCSSIQYTHGMYAEALLYTLLLLFHLFTPTFCTVFIYFLWHVKAWEIDFAVIYKFSSLCGLANLFVVVCFQAYNVISRGHRVLVHVFVVKSYKVSYSSDCMYVL